MRKVTLLILILLTLSGCGPGVMTAPSGRILEGIPPNAVIVLSNDRDRVYKHEGCTVTQQFRYNDWEIVSVNCD